jgi:hypothetical protein
MKPNLHVFAPALLLVGLAGVGCTVKQALVGISPDKVDQIEVGTDRATVEDLVDEVESEMSCTSGAKVDYVYDRGNPRAPYPVLAGPFMLAFSAWMLGLPEARWGACRIACQNGILEVIYDSDGKVVAAKPKFRSYYAGYYCDRGNRRSICDDIRSKAAETDLARRLRGGEEEVRATGCSPSYAGVVQTPKEPPAELKAHADEGDVEAQNELADYYRFGWGGVEKNIIKSYAWRTLSLRGEDPLLNRRAARARDLTEREMTADQIAEAESLVAEWKPNPAE